jgi:hypothetical protein
MQRRSVERRSLKVRPTGQVKILTGEVNRRSLQVETAGEGYI